MQNNMDNQVNAGFFVRLAAYLIDSLIVGIALALVVQLPIWISTLAAPDNFLVRDFIFTYSIKDIVIYLLSAMYFVMLTYKTGETIGKKVLHIKVVSAEDRKLTLFEVIYRETVGRFLSELIVCAGYFMVGIHKEKRGLHDLLSDTKVVYCHKETIEVETPITYQEIPKFYMPNSYAMPQPAPEYTEEPKYHSESEVHSEPEEYEEPEIEFEIEIYEDVESETTESEIKESETTEE